MAHESFENEQIASFLNENFIPVKIDREERPDIDHQYMEFVVATNGSGGWPLNVFVTPDLEPVFGGTYWPGPGSEMMESRRGAGFEQVLKSIAAAWKDREDEVRRSGKKIVEQWRHFVAGEFKAVGDGDTESSVPDFALFEESQQHFKHHFDHEYGGFGRAPKFPTPAHLKFLLSLGAYGPEVRDAVGADGCRDSLSMVIKTLDRMAKGGIKDQVGHGFARYSVTRDWSLPHFEKM
jgi:uncharacterized protein YyaL (SSP411 family)